MYRTEAQTGWRATDWWRAGLRSLVLLVLLAGVVSALVAFNPPMRPTQELVADIDAGRVTYLEYDSRANTIRWASGWWRWRTTTVNPGLVYDASVSANQSQTNQAVQWLRREVADSGHPVMVHVRSSNESKWWPAQVVWQPLRVLAIVAWLVTFGLMLTTTAHRYANRWAWFWLFTVGQIGALLYLVLEPRPIWQPRSAAEPPGRTPAGGGTGCLWSILLSIAVPLVVLGVVWVFTA